MLGIPRRYAHFVFSVIRSGLTCLIAAGIARLPSLAAKQPDRRASARRHSTTAAIATPHQQQ
jgi:hypothetical protein